MARRQRKSGFEQTVESLSTLPWQACLVLAVIAYFGFHRLAEIQTPAAYKPGAMGHSVSLMIYRTAGLYLQYFAPLTLVLAALVSRFRKRRRQQLLADAENRTASAPLQQLSWREFEQLVGAHFERLGYVVSFTPNGADGGVDVIARKGSDTFLIQCKQWRATQIGVSVVRELFGVMAARGATGAYVVSIGSFSKDAQAFADGRNIELVNANTLLRPTASASSQAKPISKRIPTCPKCGAEMVRRVAKQGTNKGQTFFGCSSYPRCRGTLPAS